MRLYPSIQDDVQAFITRATSPDFPTNPDVSRHFNAGLKPEPEQTAGQKRLLSLAAHIARFVPGAEVIFPARQNGFDPERLENQREEYARGEW